MVVETIIITISKGSQGKGMDHSTTSSVATLEIRVQCFNTIQTTIEEVLEMGMAETIIESGRAQLR